MRESKYGHMVEPLREMLSQAPFILQGFRDRCGRPLAGFTCDFLPFEVIAAAGVVPLIIPRAISGSCCNDKDVLETLQADYYDYIIHPENCCCSLGSLDDRPKVLTAFFPAGYGEDAHVPLSDELDRLLHKMGLPGVGAISKDSLREHAIVYNGLRRAIRGISALRRGRPWLLSHVDFQVLMDAAMGLPVEMVIESLLNILKTMGDEREMPEGKGPHALVYGGSGEAAYIFDDIEEEGIIIAEDDMCGGRRQFDLSINTESAYLYDEIIDAFTYRPLCPVVRTVAERQSLLYAMLKGQGIELVIFFGHECCAPKNRDIDYLRVRLMRSGIDPLVLSKESEVALVREYLKKR